MITAILIGPRIGKYGKDGKINPIKPHHIPMVMLGTFILAFGWFGFNAGSSLAGGDGRIGIVATNTMLAGMSATVFGMVYMWMTTGKPDPSMMCNSMLAGLVAITSPCAFVSPVGAFIIGAVAGVLVIWSVNFFDKIKIDDPVGAISVHGVNGAWGLIAVGLFSDGSYGQGWNGVGATDYLGVAGRGVTGLFYGDSKQLVAQLVEVVRRPRLERRRRRRRLLGSSASSSGNRVLGRGRDRRARHAGDGRRGLSGLRKAAEEVAGSRHRREGRVTKPSDEGLIRNEQQDGRASRIQPLEARHAT